MHTELSIHLSTLYAFLVVLARVSGVLVFTPIPGAQAGPDASRVVLALALTVMLMPVVPPVVSPSVSMLAFWAASEAVTGLLIGLTVSLLLESLQMAAHLIELPAGFSYASIVNPESQADSTLLQVLTELLGGLLFCVLGFDRQVIRILVRSFEILPPGSVPARAPVADALIRAGAGIFVTGLRLALPVLALLLLVDLAIAVLGRIQAQLQLLPLSFSIKLLAGLLMLAGSLSFYPAMIEKTGTRMFAALGGLLEP
ncbi:MAG TPA: flagellar biosynthetic protein FliR [Bryobacteraceae bacterium]|nr:flagellar biosynthetic protein FliR [Bryobacteraceae bacterium]